MLDRVLDRVLAFNLNTPRVIALFFAFSAFVLSMVIYPFATGGDQEHYNAFFELVPSLGFLDAYKSYRDMLGAREPLYFLIVYIASPLFSKGIFMSLVNAALVYYLFLWLRKEHGVSTLVLALISTNFYFMVLMFAAERLKFAFLFLMMALVYTKAKKYSLYLCSLLSHLQIIMLGAAIMLGRLPHLFSAVFKQGVIRYELLGLLLGFFFFGALGYVFKDYLAEKIMYYASFTDMMAILKPSVFMLLTFVYAGTERYRSILEHLVIILAALVVGEERLVIFSYMIFMYYGIRVNHGVNTLVLVVNGYFFIKGCMFLNNIIVSGDGFDRLLF